MPDNLTPEQRRRAMQRVKSKNTSIEVVIRSALHRRGIRFRKHVKGVPGTPDIVFTRRKIAVFLDGGFWHGYDFDAWKNTLSEFWRTKIERNIARDLSNFARLEQDGWIVIRIWQHEIQENLPSCVDRIISALVLRGYPLSHETKD